jgi:hypothetical protein
MDMKTKNRTTKAICVILLIGFGVIQNWYFDIDQATHNSVELNKTKQQEVENDLKTLVVLTIESTSTAFKQMVLSL